jgi:hypothetical protein
MTTTTMVTARQATKSTMMAEDDMDSETGDGTAEYDDDDDGDG